MDAAIQIPFRITLISLLRFHPLRVAFCARSHLQDEGSPHSPVSGGLHRRSAGPHQPGRLVSIPIDSLLLLVVVIVVVVVVWRWWWWWWWCGDDDRVVLVWRWWWWGDADDDGGSGVAMMAVV